MLLLQQDLLRAMFAAARQPSLACLAGICQVGVGPFRQGSQDCPAMPAIRQWGPAVRQQHQCGCVALRPLVGGLPSFPPRQTRTPANPPPLQVALALYVNLGSHMLLQVEALLSLLLLPMAEGRAAGPGGAHSATSLELQQVALEGVLDFCTQPGFARDVYLNLDCRWVWGGGRGRRRARRLPAWQRQAEAAWGDASRLPVTRRWGCIEAADAGCRGFLWGGPLLPTRPVPAFLVGT